jgi:threonyl-tRNA synthetase
LTTRICSCVPTKFERKFADCLDFAIKVFETYGFDRVRFELSVRGEAENKGYLALTKIGRMPKIAGKRFERTRNFLRAYRRRSGVLRSLKLTLKIEDAIGRIWQLGTIQLDFNLPERFILEYTGEDGQSIAR